MILIHIEDPSFKEIQVSCAQSGNDVTVPLNGIFVQCRCEANRKEAYIGFDLEAIKMKWRADAQRRLTQHHGEYMAQHFTVHECKTNGMVFTKTTVNFHVLKRDAEEWFHWIYEELQNKGNFLPL